MKKLKSSILTIMCVMIMSGLFAQSATLAPAVTPSSTLPQDKELSDPAMGKRLQADLSYRNDKLGNNPVTWYDNGTGYYGSYSVNDQNYLTRYDKDGRYQETLMKKDWNDATSSEALRSSLDKSPYKGQEVTGYWAVSDPDKTGYYLELQNKKGKRSRVWADENGKLSKTAPNHSVASARSKQ